MRALQLTASSPDGLELAELPEPSVPRCCAGHGVVVDVKAAGVSFPEVLQSRGQYQFKPDLPFVPGAEVAGTVRSAREGAGFPPGDRVAALTMSAGSRAPPSRHRT